MQSKQARITIFVLAVAVGIGLFFLFQSDDDDAAPGTTTTAATTQTTTDEPTKTSDRTESRPEAKPNPEVPEIVVAGGEPRGGVAALGYKRGERVQFVVRSDVAEEIHVHGYDVTQDVPASGKAEVSFPADLEGIFEIELHGSGALIAELTVEP